MGTVACVFSFSIVFSLSSPPDSHSHSLGCCAFSLSLTKNPPHPFILSSLSLSHISLFLIQSMPPAWQDRRCGSQRGEIDVRRVAWSWWWRCGFELMIDGRDMGRPQWWFNLSLWCGMVLVCVGLLGLGWFGLWVDLGMCGGMEVWRHGDDGVLIGVDFSLCRLINVGWSDVESNFSCGLIGMCGLIWFFFGF